MRATSSCLLLAVLAHAAPVPAHDVRRHGAHVHGEATLEIAQDGRTLSIGLDAPGDSLLGFEHPPRTDAERRQLAGVLALLKSPGPWLAPDAKAACRLLRAAATSTGYGAQAADADGHAGFEASYRYDCAAPAALDALDVRLFARFPALHKVNVRMALPSRQDGMQLLPGQSRIRLGS